MGDSKDDIPVWAAAQAGEELQNAKPEELAGVIQEAPWLPDEVIEVLDILKREYDPDWKGSESDDDPRYVEDTERYQEIVARWTSKGLSKAIRNGHDRMVSSWLGVVEKETDIDGIQSMVRFAKWTVREAGVTYLAGHMGSGKTDFGLLMAEVFYKQLRGRDKDVHIATNIQSCAEWENDDPNVEYVDNQPDLQEWLQETEGWKIFIFDEASSHASGYSSDAADVVRQFRSMIRLLRKSDASMVIIGHDGKDLHPTVRELADYVEKEDKKEASVFFQVQNREGENKRFDISRIPETNLTYDTKEASSWEWASQEGEDGKSIEVIAGETYVETELSQEAVGDIFEMSQSKVSKAKRAYLEWEEEQASA